MGKIPLESPPPTNLLNLRKAAEDLQGAGNGTREPFVTRLHGVAHPGDLQKSAQSQRQAEGQSESRPGIAWD